MLVHRHDPPDRFVVGTVGEPGARTFYLQARTGRLVTSVALEKQQVSILAERITVLLEELERTGDIGAEAAPPPDGGPLDVPLVEEFRVGTMTLSWDGDDQRIVVEAFPVGAEEPDADDTGTDDPVGGGPAAGAEVEADDDPVEVFETTASEVFLVRLPPSAARGFAARAEAVVSAGRPPCPFCGQPLDPEGHLCPRANGFRRVAQ
jgi:uncharacterized repeat protein (TIGR03847 family)